MLARYRRFRHILIFERRGILDRAILAFSLGIPLTAGVAGRILLRYDAADLTLEGSFLVGLIAGPYAGAMVGALTAVPALIAGEYGALPFAVGCGFAGGGLRELCPKEAIWHFSPFVFSALPRRIWNMVRRVQVDWQIVLVLAPVVYAAQWFQMRRSFRQQDITVDYDSHFVFTRIRYNANLGRGFFRGGGGGWEHDYPTADRNLAAILEYITNMRVRMDGSNVLDLDDPQIFENPILYMSEPGFWTTTEAEARNLREYLLKGGFAIFDDFSGNDWYNFETMMRRVIPGVEMVRMTVDHPIFHSFFEVETLELQHPNYRGYTAQFYGVFEGNDPDGRLLAIVNYNTDIGDYFEYSETGFVPLDITNEAYKLGVNYWVYALTR